MDSGSSVVALSLSSRSSKGSIYSSSEALASVITVSSETQRVPVSWESSKVSGQKDQVLNLEETPDNSEKVKNWMNSCKYDDKRCDSSKNDESNTTTCIRYDFNKSPAKVVLQSCYTFTTPLSSYMEEAKKITKLKTSPSPENCKLNGSKSNTKGDAGLSPESQKKELCSYLQLMKPDGNDDNCLVEHRRSTRAKSQPGETKEKMLSEIKVTKDKELSEVKDSKERKRSEIKETKDRKQEIRDKKSSEVKDSKEKKRRESKEDSGLCDLEKVGNDVSYPTLKSFGELNIKLSRINVFNLKRKKDPDVLNKFLPLPPKRVYSEVIDFDDSIRGLIEQELEVQKKKVSNGTLKKMEKRRKFNFRLKFSQKLKNGQFSFKRLNLRSKNSLRNTPLDKLILRKNELRKKARKKLMRKKIMKKGEKNDSPRCEIVSVHTNSDDENVDLKNFVDDMLELDKMSEEHRKSVIESRILASSSITNLINKRNSREDVQRAYKIFSDLSNEKKNFEEKENTREKNEEKETVNLVPSLIISEHDYAHVGPSPQEEDCPEEAVENSLSPVPMPDLIVLPVSKEVKTKSLHRSLTVNNRRKLFLNNYGLHNWNSGSNSNKKSNHPITISKKNGAVLRAFYQDYNLVIAQQNFISFWTQSALGNVLGAQNMWIPKGEIPRIALNSTYVQKEAMDMVITTETSVAYVELWTKEHKSDVREAPMADVFAIVYFWRLRQSGLDKKALQLENIKGFTDDVQYCVLKCYPRIIVSWHSVQGNEKKTKIHSYHLAADFQTVANISEIQPVEHYVASLHNIEDCDSLVMGCGDNKITLWNVEYGYIVATIEMSTIKSPLSTLWVKCDRGFLFTIQECMDQELRLIAINGMNHSWKKLQNYNPLPGFDRLKGVGIENGILVAYYAQGILCWNAQTGELIVEEVANECDYIPSGKHVIMIVNENIIVRHSLSHLITDL